MSSTINTQFSPIHTYTNQSNGTVYGELIDTGTSEVHIQPDQSFSIFNTLNGLQKKVDELSTHLKTNKNEITKGLTKQQLDALKLLRQYKPLKGFLQKYNFLKQPAYKQFIALRDVFFRQTLSQKLSLYNYKKTVTQLHVLIDKEEIDLAKAWIELDPLWTQAPHGHSPIHIAARKGNFKLVKLMVKLGLSIHTLNYGQNNPLNYACMSGNKDLVKFLLEKRAKINSKNRYSDTPLHFAASCGHVAIVTLLLESGANIDAKDRYGSTPFHVAVEYGRKESVEVMFPYVKNLMAQNGKGLTPLQLAKKYKYQEIEQLLLLNITY